MIGKTLLNLGLVLAALIVGAALMMDVPTTFTLFGYPAQARARRAHPHVYLASCQASAPAALIRSMATRCAQCGHFM